MATAGVPKKNDLPKRKRSRSTRLPQAALKNPIGSSKIFSEAVNPVAASWAASRPFRAAWPAFKPLAIVPRLARKPALNVPAIPKAWRVWGGFNWSRGAQAGGGPQGTGGSGGGKTAGERLRALGGPQRQATLP